MATPTSARAALAAAIRRCNVEFERLTPAQQEQVEIVTDGDLDAALLGDDEAAAHREVERWADRQLAAIRRAT